MPDDRTQSARFVYIVAMAVALCITAVSIRAEAFYYPVPGNWFLRKVFIYSYYDIATIFCVTLFVCAAVLLTRRILFFQKLIVWLYSVFAYSMVFFFCINSRAIEVIGGSITYGWLYYGDFFRSFTSRTAVLSNLDFAFLTLLIFSVLVFSAGYWLAKTFLFRIREQKSLRPVATLGLLLTIGYLLYGARYLKTDEIVVNHGEIANPLLELISTAINGDASVLSKMPTRYGKSDFVVVHRPSSFIKDREQVRDVRNVVLIVMESVGADSLIGTAGLGNLPGNIAPNLTKARSSGRTFTSFYAHAPLSTKSLFSILASRYPLFSYTTEISRIGKAPFETLSGTLKSQGYRTAFFMSGDFGYQDVDRFLDGRGFDTLSDINTIPCSAPKFAGSTSAFPHLDSVDDLCTASALTKWIGDGSGEPFFAMMWTGNTHWPYFSLGEQSHFSDESHQNRYLNALRSSDAAIGRILDYLSTRNLTNKTLIVVIGDHGEAFGQHGAKIHGDNVFEEQVHVPLVLINPQLFHGLSDPTVGGMIDLAPTILELLNIECPQAWQGRSMFAGDRSPRAYFLAANREMVAGYREGDLKFIFDPARNKLVAFDLKSDPSESNDISKELGSRATEAPERLAAWIQYQEKIFAVPFIAAR